MFSFLSLSHFPSHRRCFSANLKTLAKLSVLSFLCISGGSMLLTLTVKVVVADSNPRHLLAHPKLFPRQWGRGQAVWMMECCFMKKVRWNTVATSWPSWWRNRYFHFKGSVFFNKCGILRDRGQGWAGKIPISWIWPSGWFRLPGGSSPTAGCPPPPAPDPRGQIRSSQHFFRPTG